MEILWQRNTNTDIRILVTYFQKIDWIRNTRNQVAEIKIFHKRLNKTDIMSRKIIGIKFLYR